MTGYIGGDGFYAITQAHPELEFTCTVRNSDKGASVAKDYPKVKLAYGDLDSYDMLVEEASKADIVLRKSSKKYPASEWNNSTLSACSYHIAKARERKRAKAPW